MHYNDKPINRPAQDVFRRAKFAGLLASAIDNFALAENAIAKDGYVIALHGKWGSGKTSTIELLVRRLRHLEMARASKASIWPNREPDPKTEDQLEEMSTHFEAIEDHITEIENDNRDAARWEPANRLKEFSAWLGSEERGRVADQYWKLKVAIRRNPRTLIVRFSPWLFAGQAELAAALLSELARSLGQQLGSDVTAAFGELLGRLAELAPIAGAGINLASGSPFGSFLSASGSLAKKAADRLTTGPTLEQFRTKLRVVLRRLSQKQVLVIVDDLDRLTPQEALAMVSLVKGLGDLPNIIYLLSYDGDMLSKMLKTALVHDEVGNFLDKIVQYSVELPLISTEDMSAYFFNAAADFYAGLAERDQTRFRYAWNAHIRYYIQTPRDVRRLINHFSFSMLAMKDYVDPIDLLILEVFRLFDPGIYLYIKENIAELVD